MIPKNTLVTGGNRGIGLQFVRILLNKLEGAGNIFATCRQPEKAKELQDLVPENKNLHILKLDVTDYDSLPNLVANVEKVVGAGGLNMLINNAGIVIRPDLHDVTPEHMRKCFEVNTIAPIMITKAFHPLLKKAASNHGDTELNIARAAVVNVTSKMGSVADNKSGGRLPYRASKAALNILSKSMAVTFEPDGILSFVVHPGWVLTEMGGPNALIDTETCVNGLFKVMEKMNSTEQHKWFDYKGDEIPW